MNPRFYTFIKLFFDFVKILYRLDPHIVHFILKRITYIFRF